MMKRSAAVAAGVMVVAGLTVAVQTDMTGIWSAKQSGWAPHLF